MLEIAVPLASKSLTFFIGSGFSKYLTNGKAPSWPELLVELIKIIDTDEQVLLKKLFEVDAAGAVQKSKFELFICAQIIELEYKQKKKNIRESVVSIINSLITPATVDKSKAGQLTDFFDKHPEINIVTTNYDTLISDYILSGFTRVFVDGSAIPKANMGGNVFHIHGCITNPDSIVLTISDYFKFQHRDTYLSRKFYTLLQETTVVVLGYSLGDFNLNSILNEAQNSRAVSLRKSDIFLVSRTFVDSLISDFYHYTYGIKVITEFEINEFIEALEKASSDGEKLINESDNLSEVLAGKVIWTDSYLKLNHSLERILLQASFLGIQKHDARFIKMFFEILERKMQFTTENGAWPQYEGFAKWLIEIGSLVNVQETGYAERYFNLVRHSFQKMKKEAYLGYSWAAFGIWETRYRELLPENQTFIKQQVAKEFYRSHCVYLIIGPPEG